MSGLQSDALVFFGATGDLAYKKIFPALQQMIKGGTLTVPVIGVAKSGWTLPQLQTRIRRSLEEHGGVDAGALTKLLALLRYVDGEDHIFRIDHYLGKTPVRNMEEGALRLRAVGATRLRRGNQDVFASAYGHQAFVARDLLPAVASPRYRFPRRVGTSAPLAQSLLSTRSHSSAGSATVVERISQLSRSMTRGIAKAPVRHMPIAPIWAPPV